ncbi:hypothetical protein FNV43_RR08358 [Rhamnella rubrinervis]|uniref:Uncharacterized protein n=1 Tax=Rhamnella rubrinervis TaxID=2594499 RepID=A0A8K0HH23_9ROSA|nr:hypothetical protein FNV43_RR08358 [Rhamnella rubrinervis]
MDIANRLESIEQEIRQVENEKLQCEQRLGLFWEHLPPLDPMIIQKHMLSLQNEIRSLENRKRALLKEQQERITDQRRVTTTCGLPNKRIQDGGQEVPCFRKEITGQKSKETRPLIDSIKKGLCGSGSRSRDSPAAFSGNFRSERYAAGLVGIDRGLETYESTGSAGTTQGYGYGTEMEARECWINRRYFLCREHQ